MEIEELGRAGYRRVNVPEMFGFNNKSLSQIDHEDGIIFVTTLVSKGRALEAFLDAVAIAEQDLRQCGDMRLIPLVDVNSCEPTPFS
jgi:hypothetical protein